MGGGHMGGGMMGGGHHNVAPVIHPVVHAPVVHAPVVHAGFTGGMAPVIKHPTVMQPHVWGHAPHWVAGTGGAMWHHTYCPPGGVRYSFRHGGFYYAPHHYSWVRWGGGWGWGCYGWWGGRYHPYRWGCHPYYGWGYWPYGASVGTWILAAAVANSMQPTTTTTTTTVIVGSPVQQVAVGVPVMTGTAVSQPTYQYQTPNVSSTSGSTGSNQIPPPGYGFPFPEYDGKSDPPAPPTADSSSSGSTASKPVVVDETKFMTAPPEKLSDPSKIDFDYERPPADQFKPSAPDSSLSSGMSAMKVSDSTGSGMGGGMGSGMDGGGMGSGMGGGMSGGMGGMSSSSAASSSSGSAGSTGPIG